MAAAVAGRMPAVDEDSRLIPPFMFATGIESSNPTLAGGTVRVDEMEKCGRYPHGRTDFDCVQDLGLHVLRYGPPLHRSSGPSGGEAVYWLWKERANVLRVRHDGIPVVGFTWDSLTDQVDWDCAPREMRGRVNPRGLYDLERRIRPVGTAYRKIVREWGGVLPTQSVCQRVPVYPPSETAGALGGPAQRGAALAVEGPPTTPANDEGGR